MVRLAGLEPAAFGSVDRRSNPTELQAHWGEQYTRPATPRKSRRRGLRRCPGISTDRLAEKPGFEPGKELVAP
jgi:hypothetical protein